MFLLPMMQEIFYDEGGFCENKEEMPHDGEHYKILTDRKTKNYIYVQEGDKILKFNVGFSYFEVLKILERYVNEKNIDDYTIITEKEKNQNNIPTNVLPYLGKFKLEGNHKRSDNYLAPKFDDLFIWLCEKTEETTIFNKDLEYMYKVAKMTFEDGEYEYDAAIKNIIDGVMLAFIESYKVDYNELSNKIQELDKAGDKCKLEKLEFIFRTAKENKKYLKYLGLYDMFLEAAGLKKQNQKVK